MIERGCSVTTDGLEHEIKIHGSDDFPLACYEEDADKYPVKMHWHDEFEFFFVHEGVSEVHVGTREISLKEGDAVFINSGQLHSVKGGILRSIVFKERAISPEGSVFQKSLTKPLLADPSAAFMASSELTPLLSEAWEAENRLDRDRYNLERYLVTKAMGIVKDLFPVSDGPHDTAVTDRMKKILRYIDLHLGEPISNACLCEEAAVSESVLLRMFRSTVGTSPIEYVLTLRLDKAEHLLITTDMSISETASLCGFSDMSYFAKVFRQRKGMTPSERRRASLS